MSTSNAAEVLAALPERKLRQVKDSLLRQTRRSGRAAGAWRCRICGGRVDVSIRFDDYEKETGNTGQCRTPDCIHWRD